MVRAREWIIGAGLVAVVAAAAAAQGTFVRPAQRPAAPVSGPVVPIPTSNAVMGGVRDPGDKPVANAQLQLRNLRGGTIDRATTADAEGAFAFRAIEPGTYVVEMIAAGGVVVAVSEATTVGTGEVVQTLVRLTARTRTFGWWMGSTADSAVAQAASSGVLAVDPGVAASPERPQ
jgi:hypothetical protein